MALKSNNRVAIIGKGMIGLSYAVLFTGNGIPVKMFAKDEEIARQKYRETYAYLIEKGLVTEKQYDACKKLLEITHDYSQLADANVVFECVPENMEIKREVYQKIEQYCPQVIAVASASSAFSPSDLANLGALPTKVFVAHPWNSPISSHVLRLCRPSRPPKRRWRLFARC